MSILRVLIGLLFGCFHPRQHVGDHRKNQAYGSRWSQHRWREIQPYCRRRSRHG